MRRFKMSGRSTPVVDDLRSISRLPVKPLSIEDRYEPPASFLEVEVTNAEVHGFGRQRYTDYETNLPIFALKDSSVRRRYSDFEWLRSEFERSSKIVVPSLPGKAWKRLMPFRQDDGIFEEEFIERRRRSLEVFINKIAGHPLAQNERCLHVFLQEPVIDREIYMPGKVKPMPAQQQQQQTLSPS